MIDQTTHLVIHRTLPEDLAGVSLNVEIIGHEGLKEVVGGPSGARHCGSNLVQLGVIKGKPIKYLEN